MRRSRDSEPAGDGAAVRSALRSDDAVGAGRGRVYLELPPAGDAAVLVAGTINTVLAAERGHRDAVASFRLHPVAVEHTSAAGWPYQVLRWGVFIIDDEYAVPGDPFADLVTYGAVRRRRDGELYHDRRGLHDPLDLQQLDRLLTVAGDTRSGEGLLVELRRLDPPRSAHDRRGSVTASGAAMAPEPSGSPTLW